MNIWKHFKTITHHKVLVAKGCFKVSLYKQKECVEKNIPEDEAVDKLLALIRENGDDPVWNAESRENV